MGKRHLAGFRACCELGTGAASGGRTGQPGVSQKAVSLCGSLQTGLLLSALHILMHLEVQWVPQLLAPAALILQRVCVCVCVCVCKTILSWTNVLLNMCCAYFLKSIQMRFLCHLNSSVTFTEGVLFF